MKSREADKYFFASKLKNEKKKKKKKKKKKSGSSKIGFATYVSSVNIFCYKDHQWKIEKTFPS